MSRLSRSLRPTPYSDMRLEPLRFGEFIGRRRLSADSDSFAFVEMADEREEEVPRHTHADAHFLIVTRGSYLTTAAGADGRCGASTILFNPAGTTHRDRFASADGRFLTISIRSQRLAMLSSMLSLPPQSMVAPAFRTRLPAMRIRQELSSPDSMSAIVLEGLGLELVAGTLRAERTHRVPPGWLRRARELIEDRCTESITMSEIAAEVGVHSFHLSRSFRRFYRVAPGEYARECRVRLGAELLRSSMLSIAQIAARCGYADQSQFTRSFRRQLGITPGAFRSS